VLEFIDAIFANTSPQRSFHIIEDERFGLVSAKTVLQINTQHPLLLQGYKEMSFILAKKVDEILLIS
jgi:hypothetical protein